MKLKLGWCMTNPITLQDFFEMKDCLEIDHYTLKELRKTAIDRVKNSIKTLEGYGVKGAEGMPFLKGGTFPEDIRRDSREF